MRSKQAKAPAAVRVRGSERRGPRRSTLPSKRTPYRAVAQHASKNLAELGHLSPVRGRRPAQGGATRRRETAFPLRHRHRGAATRSRCLTCEAKRLEKRARVFPERQSFCRRPLVLVDEDSHRLPGGPNDEHPAKGAALGTSAFYSPILNGLQLVVAQPASQSVA